MGFTTEIADNPIAGMPPLLLAERIEAEHLPTTVLIYGHGDVINGDASNWTGGRSPWELQVEGEERALVRARHGRQQGPALGQPGRDSIGSAHTRIARVQCKSDHRNGRGSRFPRTR